MRNARGITGPDEIMAKLLPHALLAGTVTPLIGYVCLATSGVHDSAMLDIAFFMTLGLVMATWLGTVGVGMAWFCYRMARCADRFADLSLPDSERRGPRIRIQ